MRFWDARALAWYDEHGKLVETLEHAVWMAYARRH